MDKELAQLARTTEDALFILWNEDDDHSRYWSDENIEEFEDALYGVV